MTWLRFGMPLRFLRGSSGRLGLTIAAVSCGVALVFAIDLVNRAVFQAFVEIVDNMAGRAALHVTAGEGGLFAEDVATAIGGVSGVEIAVPVVTGAAFTIDGTGEQLAVHGIDIANDAAVRTYEPAPIDESDMEDPLIVLSQPDSVLLTRAFCARRGLSMGDRIDLETPSGRRRFTIRGLLEPKGIATVQGGNLVVMDIAAAERVFTGNGLVNRVDIVVRRESPLDEVTARIEAILPSGLRVEAPAQRKVDLHKVMQSIQTLLEAVGMFGIAAAFLIAFSRLTTVFEARAWQLAILRAVGVRVSRVRRELLKESLLIGLAGVALGIPAGVGLGHLLLPAIATTTAISSKLIVAEATIGIRFGSILLAAGLGIGAVALAALLPASRAARLPVVETLRSRGTEPPWEPAGHRAIVTGLALAVVTAAGIVAHARTGQVGLGMASSFLLVVTAVALARPSLRAVARPLAVLLPRLAGPIGRFAAANLLQNTRRTALAIATFGVGFGTVLWLWTLARSFEQSVLEVMPGVMRGDITVTSSNIGAGYVEAPINDGLVEELLRIPGVHRAVGERAIDWQLAGGAIAINAFDPAYFTDPSYGAWPLLDHVRDAWQSVATGDAVVVSENFVRNLGVGVGDSITLATPSGPQTFRITGVTRDFLSPRGTVEMSRDTFKRYWHDDHIIRALVVVDPGADVETVRRTIATALGERYQLNVRSLRAQIDWFAEQVRRAFGGLHILAGLVLIVVLVGVGDALVAGTLERTRELGIARAVGLRRRTLGGMVLLEAVALAVLGLVLAWALGMGLGFMWVKWTFPSLLGWTLSLHVPFKEAAAIGMGTVAVALAAAYVPAGRAVRLDAVVALRAE